MKCRYDRAAEDYLTTGDGGEPIPCRRDEYGDPTRHCTARLTCSIHIGTDELTCPRCIGRVRRDIREVAAYAALMLPAAIGEGVDSAAASLAAPAADPRRVRAVRFYVDGHATHAYRAGRIDGETFEKILAAMPDDDELHPYSVLTRWQMMLSEDYGHDLPDKLTTAGAAAYLNRHLHRVAQDPEQEFRLLAREVRQVRKHLESVLHNSTRPDRGVPCPECVADGRGVVRLVRHYAERWQADDDSLDKWKCPRCHDEWTHGMYVKYLADRKGMSA